MKKLKKIFFILIIANFMVKIYAFEQFIIKNINVNGLQRIEIGTIYNYLPIKAGDALTSEKADLIIQKLYATGFFKDIRLEKQNDTLIINVMERPIIAELGLTGDHAFDHDKLLKSLNDSGLMSGRIFDQGVLEQAVLSLKSEYYNRGLYSVTINSQVIPLSRNRVAINIAIDEGVPAKIINIQFIGNNNFSQSKLKKQIFLSTGNWLSWWYKDNQYSNDKLAADIETIRAFYLNQGYINFKISSIQVQVSDDKKYVYITINLEEGSQYHIDNITIAGTLHDVPISELNKLISLSQGEILNQNELNKNIDNIKAKLGDYGYAFAQVNPIPKINDKNKTIAFIFLINLGDKVYVDKINIIGNNKTRDQVIRREIRQPEASIYSSSKIKRSTDRIKVTGFFKNVDVTTSQVPNTNNKVDLNVKVEENNTGSFNFSAGYSQGPGILLGVGLSQANLFGSGKSLSLNANTSSLSQNIGLSFTDPYFRPNGMSLGYDLYYTNYTPYQANISPYSTQTVGVKIRTGVPISEYDKLNFAVGAENVAINLYGNDIPFRFYQFDNQFGENVNTIPFSVSWVRNTTDSSLWPTTGGLFNEIADMTLPVIGPRYYRLTSQNTWFFPLYKNLILKTNAQFGLINAYGDSNIVPFYQNYYIGGINSLRGFYINSIGPKDTDNSTLGGTREILFSNELLIPMPFIKDEHIVRLGAFFDTGTLWGGDSFNVTWQQEFRASYGVSLTWISPFAPIKFSFAKPLFTQPNDDLEPFQFMFGTAF